MEEERRAARAAAFVDHSTRISVVQIRYPFSEGGELGEPVGCLLRLVASRSSVRVHLSAAGQQATW